MTFEEFHPLLASTINAIATEYGRKGSWFGAEKEDFEHEMICWLLEREERIGQRFADDVGDAIRYSAQCLRNECRDHLAAQRAQALGSERGDIDTYSREELKALLPALFNSEDSVDLGVGWVASLADVSIAFGRLPEVDQDILTSFYKDGYTNKLLAEMYGISEANMSYRHNRGLKRLQALLRGEGAGVRDPWKGRTALSNSAARAYQMNSYDQGAQA